MVLPNNTDLISEYDVFGGHVFGVDAIKSQFA